MKNLTLLTLSVAAGVLLVSPTLTRAGVVGSPHDFSRESWNISPADPSSVCGPCHQAHHTDSAVVPLWSHTTSGASFTMYNTTTVPVSQMKATDVAPSPNGPSLACLSCHDGVTAVNSYGGRVVGGSAVTITNRAAIGTDLTHSHPISFVYDSALVTLDTELENPDVTDVLTPVGGTFVAPPSLKINDFLMEGKHRLECTTCHAVHNQVGTPFDITTNPKLIKINGVGADGRGSLLCRSCHIK